jgi:hypothetical protein|tara:strand:- start:194 stop:1105 length:912 start_codon:yes stop_codon:yes gene_type:complete
MIRDNLIQNNNCPICETQNIIDRNEIGSKHKEIHNIFSLKECRSCGHKFLSKFPKEEYLNELYNNNSKYVFGHDPREENDKKKFKINGFDNVLPFKNHWILNFLNLDDKGEYLEIGPGLCRLYKTFYKRNWSCEGLELQPFIKAPGMTNNFKNIKNSTKNVAVALDVIEHTIDPIKFLNDVNLKLKENGMLFLTFPNSDSFKSKLLNNKWDMVVPLAHLNFFSKKSIRLSLKKANFLLIYIKEFSLVSPKRLLKNFLKLPFKLLKDLITFDLISFKSRVKEFIFCFLDIINGDQMKIVAKKIK